MVMTELQRKLLKNRERYVPQMDAQIKFRKEECALSTGQRTNDAAMRDVQIKLRKEECVLGTGQS